MTHSNSEVGTVSDFRRPEPDDEREMAPQDAQTQKSEETPTATIGDIARGLAVGARPYFTPPSVLTDPAAAIPELRKYPRTGRWTSSKGPLRTLAVGYWRAVGLPTTVVCRSVEWIAQRPGRAVLVYILWRLFTVAGPGAWLVKHVGPIIGSIAKWIFL